MTTQLETQVDISELNFDDPTPEENAYQQKLADQIWRQRQSHLYADAESAKGLLSQAYGADTHLQKVQFLRRLGYKGVRVSGYQEPVSLGDAPARNVSAIFKREVRKIRENAKSK